MVAATPGPRAKVFGIGRNECRLYFYLRKQCAVETFRVLALPSNNGLQRQSCSQSTAARRRSVALFHEEAFELKFIHRNAFDEESSYTLIPTFHCSGG
jgi:hypothetical protein